MKTNDLHYDDDDDNNDQYSILCTGFIDILKDAQDSSTVASQIESIVQQNPNTMCTEALADALIEAAKVSPKSIDTFVPAISSLQSAFRLIETDYPGEDPSFLTVLRINLLDTLDTVLFETQLHEPPRTLVDPSNLTITTALLSASGLQHGLVPSYTSASFTYQGLANTAKDTGHEAAQQVVSIGACLHLVIAGAIVKDKLEKGVTGWDETRSIVQALRNDVVITHPQGRLLLQETISIAQNNFERCLTAGKAWNILFPDA
ncbi:hypothetical protein H0H93_015844 [Arthromyces matolae]|nr:hypothetical protein H0H93_015844 [Arthromyces matolae]